jgi:cyclohexanecarboxylate-CoA ligase
VPTRPGLVDYLLAQGIARYKLPERLVLREAMPRTATGKIRKAELRAALGP